MTFANLPVLLTLGALLSLKWVNYLMPSKPLLPIEDQYLQHPKSTVCSSLMARESSAVAKGAAATYIGDGSILALGPSLFYPSKVGVGTTHVWEDEKQAIILRPTLPHKTYPYIEHPHP